MCALLVYGALCLAMTPTRAAEDAGDKDFTKDQLQRWRRYYVECAESYKIQVGDEDAEPLALHEQALLHWTDAYRPNQTHGSLFLWTRDGRPQVAGGFFSSVAPNRAERKVFHQLHSVASQPLSARRNGQLVWTTEKGIPWTAIPEVAAPAKTRARRLIQMRLVVDSLSASGVESNGTHRTFRVLTQPLYRYPADAAGAVDGGLFFCVLGTDPEVLLLIEARQTDDGPRWLLAAGRFCGMDLTLNYKDKVIWRDPRPRRGASGQTSLYFKQYTTNEERFFKGNG